MCSEIIFVRETTLLYVISILVFMFFKVCISKFLQYLKEVHFPINYVLSLSLVN